MTFGEMYPELEKAAKERHKDDNIQKKLKILPETETTLINRYLIMRGKCTMAELKI